MKRGLKYVLFLFLLALLPGAVLAHDLPHYNFATPVFGLDAAPDGSLLVADAGAGIVELRHGEGELIAELQGVADIAAIGRGVMFAVTGGGPDPTAGKLYRVSRGNQRIVADLQGYEAANNPDGGVVDSNPYDVVALDGGRALVADAGGNDVLLVDDAGNIQLVATLPAELVSTANVKTLFGCPNPPPLPPELEGICELPDMIPAEPVPTSVAVGPDGAYYVSELKGFPAPTGESRVWRIEPGTIGADCSADPACSVVYDNFTSIVDLDIAPDGTLYVVELEEATWLALELQAFFGLPVTLYGGTISACALGGGGCSVVTSAFMPTSVAVDKNGEVYATVNGLIPGAAEVIHLP